MKIGTRLLTVAGLLLMLPCLAATHKAVKHHLSSAGPATGPTFDHDPMSITVNGIDATPSPVQGITHKPNKHRRRTYYVSYYHGKRHLFLLTSIFNEAPVSPASNPITVPIAVNVIPMDLQSTSPYTAQLLFYPDVPSIVSSTPSSGIRISPAASTDMVTGDPDRAVVHDGAAKFKVSFDSSLLPSSPPQYKKLYIVATVFLKGQAIGTNCIQTITVYSTSTASIRHFMVPGHKHHLHSGTKRH
jgi:hypothetical protein